MARSLGVQPGDFFLRTNRDATDSEPARTFDSECQPCRAMDNCLGELNTHKIEESPDIFRAYRFLGKYSESVWHVAPRDGATRIGMTPRHDGARPFNGGEGRAPIPHNEISSSAKFGRCNFSSERKIARALDQLHAIIRTSGGPGLAMGIPPRIVQTP